MMRDKKNKNGESKMSQEELTQKYPSHRRTSDNPNTGHVLLFAADPEANCHYGEHCWILTEKFPETPAYIVEHCADFFGIDLEEAKKMVNPENIVDSACAWDDPQFCSDVFNLFGEPDGFSTPDGAVVFNRKLIKKIN